MNTETNNEDEMPKDTVKAEWQCMWGCGKSSANMNVLRRHEKKCKKNPANKD